MSSCSLFAVFVIRCFWLHLFCCFSPFLALSVFARCSRSPLAFVFFRSPLCAHCVVLLFVLWCFWFVCSLLLRASSILLSACCSLVLSSLVFLSVLPLLGVVLSLRPGLVTFSAFLLFGRLVLFPVYSALCCTLLVICAFLPLFLHSSSLGLLCRSGCIPCCGAVLSPRWWLSLLGVSPPLLLGSLLFLSHPLVVFYLGCIYSVLGVVLLYMLLCVSSHSFVSILLAGWWRSPTSCGIHSLLLSSPCFIFGFLSVYAPSVLSPIVLHSFPLLFKKLLVRSKIFQNFW